MNQVAEQLSPHDVQGGKWLIVDVRSASERAAGFVAGSMHLPLEQVETGVPLLEESDRPIALLCQSGVRAKLAQARLAAKGVSASVVEGGMNEWKREGLPVARETAASWSLERQVRFGAGLLVLVGTVGVAVWGRGWLLLTGFVSCGLIFAGVTDICMMGRMLAAMPWNRVRSEA